MKKILIINGANLNLLGKRQPEIYGNKNFDNFLVFLRKRFPDIILEYYQSNHEGELIDRLHAAYDGYCGIVLNAGAFTHYSYAIADAIAAIKTPVIEVHISNIYKREEFRQKSVIAPVCQGSISGFGLKSYILAICALIESYPQ